MFAKRMKETLPLSGGSFLYRTPVRFSTRRLVERLGFLQEGTYRDGFQDERSGEFKNLCPYGMLEDEYRRH